MTREQLKLSAMAVICSFLGFPPLSPSMEVNLTIHSIRSKIKGIKVNITLLLVMPFIFIDILRSIPKVYILIILSSSFLLIYQRKEFLFLYKIDKSHLLFSLLVLGLFFSMNFYQSIFISLTVFYVYYLGTDKSQADY